MKITIVHGVSVQHLKGLRILQLFFRLGLFALNKYLLLNT
jgi:hypothetical protein